MTTAGIVAVAIGAPVVLAADTPPMIRVPITLLLVCVVPGLALVRTGIATDRLTALVLAVAVSLSVDVVVAMALLLLNVWSALLGLIVLSVVAVTATLIQVAVRRAA